MFSIKELIQEMKRERKMREKVYGRKVFAGSMAPEERDRLIAMVDQIIDILKEKQKAEDSQKYFF